MKDLTRALHEAFCNELNTAWRAAVYPTNGTALDNTKLLELGQLIRDARNTGYRFFHHYEAALYLHICTTEPANYKTAQWEAINNMVKFLDHCSEVGWENLKTKMLELKHIKAKRLMETTAIDIIQQTGPFYTGKDLSLIYVYGLNGNLVHEMALVSVLYSHLESSHAITS